MLCCRFGVFLLVGLGVMGLLVVFVGVVLDRFFWIGFYVGGCLFVYGWWG